ncbi:MAG: hypothetical protein J6S85_10630 [Methanobrevibacter sp.]|nr:hypothetical protein [Methanobrevibacter sp.]
MTVHPGANKKFQRYTNDEIQENYMKINQVSKEESKDDIFAAKINNIIKSEWKWHIPDF